MMMKVFSGWPWASVNTLLFSSHIRHTDLLKRVHLEQKWSANGMINITHSPGRPHAHFIWVSLCLYLSGGSWGKHAVVLTRLIMTAGLLNGLWVKQHVRYCYVISLPLFPMNTEAKKIFRNILWPSPNWYHF